MWTDLLWNGLLVVRADDVDLVVFVGHCPLVHVDDVVRVVDSKSKQNKC